MGPLIDVILPVFLLLGGGYLAVWRGLIGHEGVEGLMTFTQKFAIPCLLFRAMSTLDLGETFHPALLGSFYLGAVTGFVAGLIGARLFFGRPWEDSVAIGFCCLFSNSLLLGLPITERAYGTAALESNYAIIAVHSPICFGIGITAMELVRAQGRSGLTMLGSVLKGMLSNALIIGILLGVAVNLTGLWVPGPVIAAVDLMTSAALPAALFGLGGVLFRYKPEGDKATITYVVAVSLFAHPAITWSMGQINGLTVPELRSAVVTAAISPGVSAYIFANMYGVAKRVAASSVLVGTALSALTVSAWIAVLP